MPTNLLSKISCLALILSLVPALQACGGGGSSSSYGSPGVSSGTVTAASRQAAFDAMTKLYSGMTHADRAAENTQLAATMAGMSVFEATGVSTDGCAWGRFRDGRLLIIANNRTIDNTVPAAKLAAIRSLGRTRAAGAGLPQSTSVRLINTMGPLYTNICPTLQGWLTTGGYQLDTGAVEAGTVSDMKAVSGDGVFYMSAHGGSGNLRGTGPGPNPSDRTVFSIWTGTDAKGLDDPAYKTDLDAQKLVYMMANYSTGSGGVGTQTATRYAITPTFVAQYMKFGPNSLVYMDACLSDNTGFKAACITAGAGVYIGWTQPTDDHWSASSALFAFDRLVGGNTQPPVAATAPPPMDWSTLQSTMASTFRPSSTTYTYVTMPSAKNFTAPILTFTSGTGNIGPILPAITGATKDLSLQDLTLTGSFGSKQGSVMVTITGSTAQTSTTIYSWTATRIIAELPLSCTSAQVIVDGRSSNKFDVSAGNANVQITPTSSTALLGDTAAFSVAITGQDPADLLTYHWSTTTNAGTITDGTQTGSSFNSTKAAITYTVSNSATVGAVDTITVLVYNGGINNPNRELLGKATAMVTIADVAIGTIHMKMSNITFDTSQLTHGTGARLFPQIFARFVTTDPNNIQLNSDHSLGADDDTINTYYLDFGMGYYVGQVLDLSSATNINQISLDLFTPAGGDYAMRNKSGTLKVTATGVDPLTGGYYFKFTATVHFADSTGATALDAVLNGSMANL